ncbi:hypothetical protein [Botryobacter ruber]|uniref:hypothetical protein n=1 Tax=Botryobacter ruber TaxID=2171629 RepID=UPI000E0C3E65|nr:hypothetical protein [Botryobacter ruber]
MTDEQFYYCVKRIYELRKQIPFSWNTLDDSEAEVSVSSNQKKVDFEMIEAYVNNKDDFDMDKATVHALIKEQIAQEDKLRKFVPVAFYGNRIQAKLPQQPTYYLIMNAQGINIEKEEEGGQKPEL